MIQDAQGRNFEGLKIAVVQLTSAQILNSNTQPIQIVPSPGPGKMIVPFIAILTLHFGGVAYTTNLQPGLVYGVLATSVLFNANFWSITHNQIDIEPIVSFFQGQGAADNLPLNLQTQTGNPAAGNGTAQVTIYYTIENSDN